LLFLLLKFFLYGVTWLQPVIQTPKPRPTRSSVSL